MFVQTKLKTQRLTQSYGLASGSTTPTNMDLVRRLGLHDRFVAVLYQKLVPFYPTLIVFVCLTGYQLCDNSNGVLFNDCTRLLLYNNNEQIEYIDKDMTEAYHTLRSYPETLVKKVTLLKYFRNYMSEHLLKVVLL